MKFIVNKDEFVHNLSVADSIINLKSPLAILLNVYIEALEDGSIMIFSYNGENGVKVEASGVVEVSGKISLSSKKLLEVARKIPGEKIVFESNEDNENEINIHPENKQNPIFNLIGVSADTFPTFNEFNWEHFMKISQETLNELISSTEFAASTDIAKVAFTGSYIEESVDGMLSFVTTDGKRLSVITREYEEKVGSVETGVIIPQKIFRTIHGSLNTGDVLFSIDNNQAFFKLGNIYIFSNLVEGKFPNYQDVIPTERINIAEVSSEAFLEAIDTVSVMTDTETSRVKIEFNDNKIIVSTSHAIYGLAHQELEIKYNGSPITVAINYHAISDFLKVVKGKQVEIVINSQSSPLLLKTINDDSFMYITMPMKLND